jgi:hypothetical protein
MLTGGRPLEPILYLSRTDEYEIAREVSAYGVDLSGLAGGGGCGQLLLGGLPRTPFSLLFFLCLSVSFCLSVCMTLSVGLSLSLCEALSLSLCESLSLWLSFLPSRVGLALVPPPANRTSSIL